MVEVGASLCVIKINYNFYKAANLPCYLSAWSAPVMRGRKQIQYRTRTRNSPSAGAADSRAGRGPAQSAGTVTGTRQGPGFQDGHAGARWRPDVILCDLGLPGLDGYAVADELRRHAVTPAARLIAVTGYGREEDQREALAAGFDLHLTKPVDVEALKRVLEGISSAER